MPRIVVKEKITKEIEIPLEVLYQVIANLTKDERKKLIDRLNVPPATLKPFKKDNIESISADFKATELYEEDFLKDLVEGLGRSSLYAK